MDITIIVVGATGKMILANVHLSNLYIRFICLFTNEKRIVHWKYILSDCPNLLRFEYNCLIRMVYLHWLITHHWLLKGFWSVNKHIDQLRCSLSLSLSLSFSPLNPNIKYRCGVHVFIYLHTLISSLQPRDHHLPRNSQDSIWILNTKKWYSK